MDRRASNFFSKLHANSMRPLGFKKVRQTFERQFEGYVEYYNFQGSQWNSKDQPWGFYLNVGMYFLLPGEPTSEASFSRAQLHGRPGHLIEAAPSFFELSESSEAALLASIPQVIAQVSAALQPLIPMAKERALKGEYTFIGHTK